MYRRSLYDRPNSRDTGCNSNCPLPPNGIARPRSKARADCFACDIRRHERTHDSLGGVIKVDFKRVLGDCCCQPKFYVNAKLSTRMGSLNGQDSHARVVAYGRAAELALGSGDLIYTYTHRTDTIPRTQKPRKVPCMLSYSYSINNQNPPSIKVRPS